MKPQKNAFNIIKPTIESEISGLIQRLNTLIDAKNGRIITFISARPDEGTSLVAGMFTTMLAAETGQKILLLDAGTHQNELGRRASIDHAFGMVDALAKGRDPSDAIHSLGQSVSIARWIGQEHNRNVAGKLLQEGAFWKLLQQNFHTVVIDAPALQVSSDGIALGVRSDGVILVVEAGTTRQPVVENLRDTLSSAGAHITGVVMNKRHYYIPDKVYARL